MATTVTKTLLIDENNASTYCTATVLELEQSSYAFYLYLDGEKYGYAHLNDAAKALIYPTATAHPFQLDSVMSHSKSGGSATVKLEFDDIAVHNTSISGISQKEHSQSGIVADVISNSTRSTKIGWHIEGSSTVSSFRVGHVQITLHFNQYGMTCHKANRAKGVASVSVSSATPYEGDPVTFSATLMDGAKWYGWYSDPEHTQLVSTDQEYSIVAGSDVTLYAYASLGTGFYFKRNNQWINSIEIYKKIDGVWTYIEKSDIDLTIQYKVDI